MVLDTTPSATPSADALTDPAHDADSVLIDTEDPQIVPNALNGLVSAAHTVLRVMEVNGCYPPRDAVAALEETAAVLGRLATDIGPYVGDFSGAAATSIGSAHELLRQARSAMSDARHHLTLDEITSSAMPLVETAPTGV